VAGRSGLEQDRPARGRDGAKGLDRIPFRRKLDVLVAIPSVAIVGLLSPLVVQQVNAARTWEAAASYMGATTQVSLLVNDLNAEQENALGVVDKVPLIDGAAYDHAIAATDAQRTAVLAAYQNNPPQAMKAALDEIDGLYEVRSQVHNNSIMGTILLQGYTTVMTDLSSAVGLVEQAANGNPAAVPEAELDVLFEADLAASEREAALVEIAGNPGAAPVQYPIAEQEYGVAQSQGARLAQFAPASDFNLYSSVLQNPEQAVLDKFNTDTVNTIVVEGKISAVSSTADAIDVTNAALAQATARANMEKQIANQVVARATHSSSVSAWTAVGLVLLAVLLLVGLLVFSVLIRHSIARPVLQLTLAATKIAGIAEEDLEDRVADEDARDGGTPPELKKVAVTSRDEIGDLAGSFNRLQETAVKVLERQVTIRNNTAEMFGNVGRRIHNLTGRQLALIDAMERSETDPVLLERLYRIDHLAVRLQRGADSLVLLSGERETALDATPMRLTDVVRSAVGRIEGYQRVVLGAEGDSMVSPGAIGDLTLMIAELVENAVAFSPTSSTVDVAVRTVSRGAVVEIVDRGVGMSADRLAEENQLLVKRDRLDLAPTKVLGLFVVGRLAQRTGARVVLAQTPGGGLTARVDVPDELLLGATELIDSAAAAPAPRTVPTPPMPEQRRESTGAAPATTATGLPQRAPRGDAPARQSAAPAATAPTPTAPGPSAPPLLPRRVRGNRSPQPSGGRQGVTLAPATALDAEAARAAIEEFEAGVDQALRDSAAGLPVRPPAATANAPVAGDTDEEKGERP
jgi:signal transduction histidine kinase